jgi:hypothetical protein
VKSALPATVPEGLRDVTVGKGSGAGLMVKLTAADFWASVFTTLTWAVPVAATSAAGIAAVICVALANVVGRLLPFH